MKNYFASSESSVVGDPNAIIAYEQTNNVTLPAISLVEWEDTHSDHKGISGGANPDLPAGIPSVMDYDQGTCLRLVRVIPTAESVTAKVAELEAKIARLEKDLEWAVQYKGDGTYDLYIESVNRQMAEYRAQISRTRKMGPKPSSLRDWLCVTNSTSLAK